MKTGKLLSTQNLQFKTVIGDSGVFKARGILAMFIDTLNFNDDALCAQQGIQYRKANTEKQNNVSSISFFPNPTKELLLFKGLEQHLETVQILVTNMLGEEVLNTFCPGSQIILNVSKLSSGVYGIKLISPTNTVLFNNKFVKL